MPTTLFAGDQRDADRLHLPVRHPLTESERCTLLVRTGCGQEQQHRCLTAKTSGWTSHRSPNTDHCWTGPTTTKYSYSGGTALDEVGTMGQTNLLGPGLRISKVVAFPTEHQTPRPTAHRKNVAECKCCKRMRAVLWASGIPETWNGERVGVRDDKWRIADERHASIHAGNKELRREGDRRHRQMDNSWVA